MISFNSDYDEGAHPRILEALSRTNYDQTIGYGEDPHSQAAIRQIQGQMGRDCYVTFISGGTLANLTVISHTLLQYEGVVSAATGHIFTNETGAIEATGHKVITCPAEQGKLTPDLIVDALNRHSFVPHVVKPKLVYLSQSTEIGTVYTLKELEAIREVCDSKGLLIYIDGARLANGLAIAGTPTLADFGRLADAFTAGGTKNGALFGEAVIIPNPALATDFPHSLRQKGGMMSKGRILGIQFEELFRDDLYIQNGAHANKMAGLLKDGLSAAGFAFLIDSPSNQQFPLLRNKELETLIKDYGMKIWNKPDSEHTYVRLVTSWATKEENVKKFIADATKARTQG
ncbi:MAG: beta-eliminating lyase-related protein [Oscillospiraceae bacterium]|nr:beta-eliminating lyase-related protein [Oscillospiraceae bacterium]